MGLIIVTIRLRLLLIIAAKVLTPNLFLTSRKMTDHQMMQGLLIIQMNRILLMKNLMSMNQMSQL